MSAESQSYWKRYYVVESDADEIERNLKTTHFISNGRNFELIHFGQDKTAPNILISPGSAGHSYIFAELGFRMHQRGYNVFVMPKHGGSSITKLMGRHKDALDHLLNTFNNRVGVFAEGFGGYAIFYLALANGPMKSVVYQNAPAILTEKRFQESWMKGGGSAQRRKVTLPFAKFLGKIFPNLPVPIWLYLDFKEMVDTKEENRQIEKPRIERFAKDPDFDRWYPLSAIMSLVLTPPPNPLSELKIPTMFLVPKRGFYPSYEKYLFNRLPYIEKKLVEVDGGVFWMCSHPKTASKVICDWFDKTI